ncbi:hypothetical protein FRC14_004492 [Serendipita sp. 396]|nr:hypothetical protein FRC14_004492 [Serendipita sp. 396]KAG8798174.1 hypothetical protein FRC16_007795 [Serendipita sp. 398]
MIIFTTRLCAIFFMRSNVQRLLVFSLVASLVALLVFHIFTFINVLPGMIWATHLRACVTPDYRTWAIGATSLTPIFMESLIFFATLFHAFEQQRNNLRVMETSTGGVLQRLYMDGIQYYMLALLFRLGAVLTFYRAPIGLILLFYHFEYLATSMLTSRFFLSFRRKLVNSQTVPSETAEITGAEIPGCLALGVELTDVVNVGTEEYAMVETRMTREHESSYGTARPFLENRLV